MSVKEFRGDEYTSHVTASSPMEVIDKMEAAIRDIYSDKELVSYRKIENGNYASLVMLYKDGEVSVTVH